jgi:anti-anti-sigma factor
MQITHSTRDGCLIVTLIGEITVTTAPQLQRTLFKDIAEGPSTIICDLGGVDAIDPICASVFATVANHPAGRWPAASVLLCAAPPAVAEVLRGLRVRHFVPLYDTLREALDAAVDRPGYLRDQLQLAPTPTAAATARRFVRETLRSWRLTSAESELIDQAELLADELVTNAVIHARSDMLLRLELGGELLHIAVRDQDWRLPRLLRDDPDGQGGRGLRLVEWVAVTWGAQPHPEGGKVVWCTLRTSGVGHSRLTLAAPPVPIRESELPPPVRRPGSAPPSIPRGNLMANAGVPDAPLMAPLGYGKATLLDHPIEQDPRSTVWLSVDEHRHDPARLLSSLAITRGPAERWADAAERGASRDTGMLPDGTAAIDGWLALLRALMCRHGVEQLRADAELACRLVPTGSLLRAPAVLLLGISYLLVEDLDSADGLLAEAVEVAEDTGMADIAGVALAERAVVAIDRGAWDRAELLIEHGRSLLGQAFRADHVTNVLLYALSARLAIRQGDLPRAQTDLANAQRLRPHLTVALPIYAVQARLELARALLALTDVAGARTLLREVDELLRRRPRLGVLGQQADRLRASVHTMHADALGASSLTAAELRLLPLLATHRTFPEIGERLQVSSNTVKTHAMGIYRKLGASSRSQAIQHAQQLGLLPA